MTRSIPESSTAALTWPDAETMMGEVFHRDWDRRLKYALRLAWTFPQRARLLREAAQDPFARALFKARPQSFYPVMTHLMHRKLGVRARVQATLASMKVVPAAYPDRWTDLLGEGIVLQTLDDGARLVLGLTQISFHEGLWQVGLIDSSGQRLYSAGFGLVDEQTMFIGNLQGVQNHPDALARLAELTQAAHGMRPPYFLLYTVRLLANAWGLKRLGGVGPYTHVKGARLHKAGRLWFDYPAFWEENGGTALADGNWSLPLEAERRPIEEIASKRRAQYRRRYAMLDELAAGIQSITKQPA